MKHIEYDLLGESAPEMPANIPNLLLLMAQKVPTHMKPSVINSVFPALGSMMHNVSFRYVDNVLHEPHFMCGIVGPMSIGKGSINPVIEAIIHKLREHDAASNAKQNEWKRQCKAAGANKQKPDRPEDIAILAPEPDMTNPALIQMLMDAEAEGNRFLYTSIPELDLLDTCCGGHKKVTRVIRLGYDLSRYGAQRATVDGISGNPVLRWNINFSCVEEKAQTFFKDCFNDGTFSRIGLSYIPRPKERSAEIPKQGIYDEAYQRQVDAFVVRLEAAAGEIECQQANRLAMKLRAEMVAYADKADDDQFDDMSKRAVAIAWLKACVLYVANGCKWNSSIGHFMRWSLYYDLWSKIALFAPKFRDNKAMIDTAKTKQNGPTNMLELLPDEFVMQQLITIRLQVGKSESGTKDQLRKWKERGFIETLEDGRYRKLIQD